MNVLAQSDGAGGLFIVALALFVLVIAGTWKAFEKAGEPGWASIVPIYNLVVMLRMAGRETWWVILFFIPVVNLVVGIIVAVDIAAKFGQSTGFGVGPALLGFIFWPILGFGDAQYQG